MTPFIHFLPVRTEFVTEARVGCGVDTLFPVHLHTDWQITIIECGTGWVTCRGRELETPAGTLFVIPPLEAHTNRSPKRGVVYRNCLVRAAFLDGVADDLVGHPAARLGLPTLVTDPTGYELMSRLHRSFGDDRSRLDSDCRLLDACRWLVGLGGRPATTTPVRVDPRLNRARDCLLDEPGADVSLAALAAVAGLSPFRFARLFKAAFGLPPHAFQIHVRVERAKHDLRAGRPPAEAAARAGFADQSHLHRHFRRIVGVTPGQFQAAVGKNVQDPHGTGRDTPNVPSRHRRREP